MRYLKAGSRGQSAVEYLIVFSAALAVFASVTFTQMINPSSDAARDTLYLSQARTAVDSIAGTINTVYGNGRGAVKSASVQIDRTWAIQLDNAKNLVRVTVATGAGSENLEENLLYDITGAHSLSNLPAGVYTVIVEWPENANARENLRAVPDNKKIYIFIKP